jgi:hypothetical protein
MAIRDTTDIKASFEQLRPLVDAHVTPERMRRYLKAVSEIPAPSTAATALRTPMLRHLLAEDGALEDPGLHLVEDFAGSGSTVILTGSRDHSKPVWYMAHLDTLSYLVLPKRHAHYPLVPFGYHLLQEGSRTAWAWRYDLATNRYGVVAEGIIENVNGAPVFRPSDDSIWLGPGDRVVFSTPYREEPAGGSFTAHIDNAGAVAALAVAARVLAQAGIDALLGFPDEEEGPQGGGNQMMGRGGSRIIDSLPPPELALVVDVQQAGGDADADTHGGLENTTRLGKGAVLAEFSSLARGAVTPPHLYALARYAGVLLEDFGVKIQESNNAYTSRSDDVSVLLKTPDILLLGFAGFNRHFDRGLPRGHLSDLVDLTKALAYFATLGPHYRTLKQRLIGAGS